MKPPVLRLGALPEPPAGANNENTRALPVALLATFGFALTVTLNRPIALAGLILALPMLVIALGGRPLPTRPVIRRIALWFGPVTLSLLWLRGGNTRPFSTVPDWFHIAGGIPFFAFALALLILGDDIGRQARRVVVIASIVTTAILGVVLLASVGNLSIDVTNLHAEAASALAAGDSPYSDSVAVRDDSPLADEGAQIVGYPYPPLALIYALGHWFFGDPRWVGLLLWLACLAITGRLALRSEAPGPAISGFLTMAAIPGWPLIMLSGWTEPLTLALLLTSLWLWRYERSSAALIGLSIASKQTMFVLGPISLLWRVEHRRRRTASALIAGSVAIVPLAFWGLSDAYRSLVTFHVTRTPRTDGTSLVGFLEFLDILWWPPSWLSLVSALTVGLVVSRIVVDQRSYALAASVVLTTAYLLSTQAFMNYWLIPLGLTAAATTFATDQQSADSITRESRPSVS